MNSLDHFPGNHHTATLRLPDGFTVDIRAKIARLIGDQIEPEQQEWQAGSFIYYSNRPTETFVVYILNQIVLEELAKNSWKELKALHIHKNVNTPWSVICWPQKVETEEEAVLVFKNWLGLVGALYISDKDDIVRFHDPENPNWQSDTAVKYWVQVQIVRV